MFFNILSDDYMHTMLVGRQNVCYMQSSFYYFYKLQVPHNKEHGGYDGDDDGEGMEDDEGDAPNEEETQEEQEEESDRFTIFKVILLMKAPISTHHLITPKWVWWWSSGSSSSIPTGCGYGTAGVPPPSPSGSPEEPMIKTYLQKWTMVAEERI